MNIKDQTFNMYSQNLDNSMQYAAGCCCCSCCTCSSCSCSSAAVAES